MDTPQIILEALTNNEQFARATLPFFKLEYFPEPHQQQIFKVTSEYFNKFNSCISPEALFIELNNQGLNENVYKAATTLVSSFQDSKQNIDWLVTTAESFCKERAVYLAIMKSISIIDGTDKQLAPDAIPRVLEEALAVTFDPSVGHDYFDDADLRFDLYQNKETKIPFGLEWFDDITGGGLPRRSMCVIAGATGAGKSMFLVSAAANYLRQGLNVIYISLEMSEARIAERIDANLLDIDVRALPTMRKSTFVSKVEAIKQKNYGQLIIKEYPTSSAHSGHFESLLNELKTKKNFKADVIIVDYLNICASAKFKSGSNHNSYTVVKSVAEEIRAMAVKNDVVMLTGVQLNRNGISSSDVEMTDTSESMGIVHSTDCMFALVVTEELEASGQILFKQLKNRFGDPAYRKRAVVGIERSKMRFYDLDDCAQDNITESRPRSQVVDMKSKFSQLK